MRKFLFIVMLMLPAFVQHAMAQTRTVTGKVTDQETGLGLPGVSVVVKGTTIGAATNAEGAYTLNVPESGTTLVFRFIGYKNVEQPVGNRSTINVALSMDQQQLDEVVIVAYGTADKSSFTGSASQITTEKIAQRPVTNITNAITGQAAGVQTTGGGGQPGESLSIRIRGFGSWSSSNEPLYVVDGVPYSGAIGNINTEDVESISILKDAASTALYGSRAANGVVMITTKKGKSGKSNINLKISEGFSTRGLKEYDRVDAYEYYPLVWEGYRNSLLAGGTALGAANQKASADVYSGVLKHNPFNVANDKIVLPDGTLNPDAKLLYGDDLDWSKELMRTGKRKDYALSYSGGSDKSDYYVSLGYLNDKGYLIKSDYERFTGRLNVNSQATDWFKTGLNISATITESNTADDASNTGYVNPFYFTRNMGPIYPVYQHDPTTGAYVLDKHGNKVYAIDGRGAGGSSGRHILAETLLDNNLFNRNVIGGRTYGEITFLKDFKFTTNLSVDLSNYTGLSYDNTLVGDGAPAGRASQTNSTTTSYNINQLLNYSKTFGDHFFDVLLGHENYDYTYKYAGGSKQNIVVDGNTELVNFTIINNLNSYTDKYRTEGYFGRLNYTFADKYTVSGSYRRDGSSRFHPDVRWGNFWSVGASWRLDKETFVTMPEWVSMIKLRGSYGEVGNDAIQDANGDAIYYAWQPLYDIGPGYNNAGEPGSLQGSLASPELLWESSNSYDVGVDFSLLNNRITGNAEYFWRGSSNLLFAVPLPLSSGLLSKSMNIGTLFNKGVELQVSADVVKTNDFTWNINANWTTLKNEFTKLPDGQDEIINGTKKIMVGRSMYDFWLRDYYGVDPNNGDALYRANKYDKEDANIRIIGNDTLTSVIANAKYHYAGSAIPDFSGGVTNTFSYKGLSLSVLMTYQVGGLVYDGSYASLMGAYNEGGAWHKDILNRWQKPGDVTNVPRLQAGTQSTNLSSGTSDRWLTDASFLNLRSVTLAYNLPSNLSSKIFAKRANVYVTGENLALFSERKGMNVNQSFAGTTGNVYTPAKILTFGLNVTL
ncbi:MAG TPA: TonB-dependent receptor [Pontibacter sp.]